jgi:hypothetical protein
MFSGHDGESDQIDDFVPTDEPGFERVQHFTPKAGDDF